MAKKIHLPHDRSQKLLFSHPSVVRDLVTGFLDGPWRDELDLDALESLPTEFVSDLLPGNFDQQHSDLSSPSTS